MNVYFVFFIVSFLHGVTQVVSWDLQTNHSGSYGRMTLVCIADTPLEECLIRVWDNSGNSTALALSQGHKSQITNVTSAGGGALFTARYEGSDLQSGECGIRLTDVLVDRVLVSCHAKAKRGGWRTRTVAYNNLWDFITTRVPEQTAVIPGGNFSIQCNADGLHRCFVDLPTTRRNASLIQTPYESIGLTETRYFYVPLSGINECHFTLTNVTTEDSGPYYCYAYGVNNNNHDISILVVSKLLTNDPELMLTSSASYKAGDIMTATCEVSNTRPAASIVWLIGSKIIRDDPVNDIDRNVLSWSWEDQVITQNISHQLRATDDGKKLVCRATVLFPRQSKIRIRFKFPCGKRKSSPRLISRGHEASRGEFPWNAAIYKHMNGSYTHLCGGTLVTNNKVITAAHCFEGIHRGVVPDLDRYRIVLGKHHLDYSYDDRGAQIMNVSDVTLPLSYHPELYPNDIAVVTLVAKVEDTSSVEIICLDLKNEFEHLQLRYGSNGTVAGWGLTENRTQSDVLRWVDLPWVNRTTCKDVIPDDRHIFLSHDIFCAGYVDANISVCRGDSGSGLVFFDETTGSYYLRGVVSISFGTRIGKCFSRLYTGFTALSSHLGFIKNNLK